MKPRLYMRHGIWCCLSVAPFQMGHGYTPREAYEDWRKA